MSLSRWLRRSARPARTFRPAVLPLEDRTVPTSVGWGSGHFSTPGPATHLQVIVPESVQSGQSFDVIVEAEDASNRIATGFTDQVTLSLGTADAGATLPAAYTFTANDHGVHEFKVTLAATGSQTIAATDTTTSNSVTAGSATTVVNPAPVATTIVVQTPEQAAVGVAARVTVEVLDQSGHLLRNFTGTVTLTSSDTSATATASRHTTAASVPITYTFTAQDHGQHTFQVTFNETAATTGTATTVTASTTTPALTDSATLTVYPATTVTHFGVFAVPFAFSGSATPVVVEALNAANQVVTGYTGTVTLTSSDTAATASTTRGGTATLLSATPPFTYTFTTGTGADNGKHTFRVTFNTTSSQTLTVADSANSLTDTETVQVLSLPHRRRWMF